LKGEEMRFQDIAYQMVDAYTQTETQGAALEEVKDAIPDADMNILLAMWCAIDAYVDTHGIDI
jgi:hypothetical protein